MKSAIRTLIAVVAAAGSAIPAAAIDWSFDHNATREGDIAVVDTHGSREGGAVHGKIDLGGITGGIRATIRARGVGIGRPDKSYFGLKFMFHYIDPETHAAKWPQADHRGGDFDWTTLELVADLGPKPVGDVDITLGLQNVEGHVEFDLSSFEYGPHKLYEFPRHNQGYIVRYPDDEEAHAEPQRERSRGDGKENLSVSASSASLRETTPHPQLRGAMLPYDPTEDDIRTLAEWGGTIGRFQMSRNFQKIDANLDFPDYVAWLDGRLDLLESVLGWARKYGMKICVDLHVPPGSVRDNSEMRMFTDKACLDLYVECWEKIARRFKGNTDVIYGYDLLNEPHQNPHDVPWSYWDAQRLAAEAIRRIDPDTAIVMEANLSSSAPAYEYMSPLAMPNVIYEIHMYIPSEYTHQGVTGGWSEPRKWPDESRGWNKEMLRRKLEPVVAFAKRHHARIFVGEFSAIAWAEGADRYLRDCIELFNEYGWDWCYHAFNEWRGWNVEYAGDSLATLRHVGDTPRKRVLIEGLRGGLAGTAPAVPFGTVPPYWREPLAKAADRIRALSGQCDDAFFFITDLHIPANRRVSGRLLAALIADTGVTKVICNGDMPEAFGDKDSIDRTIAEYREAWVAEVERAGGDFYATKGNHDFTIRDTPTATTGFTYSSREARDILMDTVAIRANTVTNPDDPEACYYYVDFPEKRIRYIVADTTDSLRTDRTYWAVKYGMGETQLRWLAENALATIPAGWSVLVVNHIPVAPIVNCEGSEVLALMAPWRALLEAYQNRGKATVGGREYDFSCAEGTLLCDLTGHEHCERQTFLNGLWHITQPSDAAYNADFRYGSAPWGGDFPDKAKGTPYEQTFDAVHIDLANRALHFTRIGGGGNRIFHLDARIVRVGETITMYSLRSTPPGGDAATLLSAGGKPREMPPSERGDAPQGQGGVLRAATWACYDADRVQTSPHPDNKWQKRFRYFNDVAEISPEGVLTAKKPGEAVVLAIAPNGDKEFFAIRCVESSSF